MFCVPSGSKNDVSVIKQAGQADMAERSVAGRSGQKAYTRQQLLNAGRRLFASQPVDAIAIDTVVAAAGVSKGSFYNHFADRQALVEAIVGEIRDGLNRVVVAANDGEADAARRVARAVCIFLRYAVDAPQGAAVLARIHGASLAVDAPHNKPLVDDIGLGLAAGRFRIPTVESGVLVVIGIVQVGLFRILQEPAPALAVATAQQLTMLLLRGLGIDGAEAADIAAQAADDIVRGGLAMGEDLDSLRDAVQAA
jgi:AcrR family transcriptional regulator